MASKSPIDLTVDQQALVALRKALGNEAGGKKLARDLGKNLRAAAAPAVVDAKSAVRALPAVNDVGLREAVASQISAQARMSGKSAGVAVKVGTRKDPRGFRFAGRRLNNPRGWRHPVFGTGTWVVQRGQRWFEPAVLAHREEYRAAVRAAMEEMAQRIARKVKAGQ